MAELYRHFDKRGRLLYVGISASAVQRLARHKITSEWFSAIAFVKIERFSTRAAAQQAEAAAIPKERPRYDIVHNLTDPIELPLPARKPKLDARAMKIALRMEDDCSVLRAETAAEYLGIDPYLLCFAIKTGVGPKGFTTGTGRVTIQSWRTNARLLKEWELSGGIAPARTLYRRTQLPLHERRRQRLRAALTGKWTHPNATAAKRRGTDAGHVTPSNNVTSLSASSRSASDPENER